YALGRYPGPDDPERAAQVSLVREFLGNPFRPLVLAPSVFHWNDRIIPKLAGALYADRALPSGPLDNGRLAILADAVEEAGCTDAEVLAHLRGPGPHVRGCWALDALLLRTDPDFSS